MGQSSDGASHRSYTKMVLRMKVHHLEDVMEEDGEAIKVLRKLIAKRSQSG